MTILQAVILGLVQGVAEFLPISSSGHLVIFQSLLGLPDGESYIVFDILLHVGTLVSVLYFYKKDVAELIVAFFGIVGDLCKGRWSVKGTGRHFLVLVVLATVPLVGAFLIKDSIEAMFSSPLFVGVALLVTGVILYITDRLREGRTAEATTTYRTAFLVGLFQLFAILPGISRSGTTIFGGRLLGLKKDFAVKFSLLMSVAAVLGTAAASVPDAISGAGLSVSPALCLLAMAVAAVSGILSIRFLVRMLNKGHFKYFSFYCWIVGAATIITSMVRW